MSEPTVSYDTDSPPAKPSSRHEASVRPGDIDTPRSRWHALMRRLEEIEEKQDRVLAGSQLETLTTKQVMSVLQIGRTKLTELVQSGELQMWKLGGERRITRAGLEAFIRSKARE